MVHHVGRVMFNLGFGELVVIFIVLIIAVGPDRLPTFMKGVGKTIRTVRQASRDIRATVGLDEMMREDVLAPPPRRPPPPAAIPRAPLAPPVAESPADSQADSQPRAQADAQAAPPRDAADTSAPSTLTNEVAEPGQAPAPLPNSPVAAPQAPAETPSANAPRKD